MKLEPKINWIPFDKCMPPADLSSNTQYLIFLREDDHDNGATWTYSVDVATAYGSYLGDFWDTETDWKEGQRVEVLAYAELPYGQKEEELRDNSLLKMSKREILERNRANIKRRRVNEDNSKME